MAPKLNIKTGTGFDDFIDLSTERVDWKVNLGNGNDVLLAGSGNDTVNAGDGNDKVTGGAGNDSINGNDGFDTAVYAHSVFDYLNENGMLNITPLLGNAISFATPMEGTDTLKNIEALEFSDATYYMDGRNNSPIAQDFSAQTDEDTAIHIDMTGRYVDLDGDAITLSAYTTSGALVTFDPDTNTLLYDPNGQFEYLNAGDPAAIDTIYYQVDDGHGGVTTAEITVGIDGVDDGDPISDGEFHAAYMTGSYNPWGMNGADIAMDMAFNDKGGWEKFNGFDASIFSGDYDFVYLDGGDGMTWEFEAFIDANRDAMEQFVSDGGSLLINAARWDDYSDFDLGFGITLTSDEGWDATVVATASSLIDGPNGYAGTNFSGTLFAHDSVSGEGLSALITDPNDGNTILGEMDYDYGFVLAGGMTDPFWHYPLDPGGDATVLRANIYEYAASQTYDWMFIA